MKVIYVAGPYSAPDSWQRERNIRAAERVAHDVIAHGPPDVAVICVHAIARHWHGSVDEETAIAMDMELLRRSDFVVLADGWQWSKGTQAEIREAAARGMPIFECLDDYYLGITTSVEDLVSRFDEEKDVPF